MITGYIALLLIIKFFTISWLFDFIPSKSMFRKQLETTLSIAILSSLILVFFISKELHWLTALAPIYVVVVCLFTEVFFNRTFDHLRLHVQYKVLGLLDHQFDDLPDIIKDDVYTLLLVFYNVVYVLVIVAMILYWPK